MHEIAEGSSKTKWTLFIYTKLLCFMFVNIAEPYCFHKILCFLSVYTLTWIKSWQRADTRLLKFILTESPPKRSTKKALCHLPFQYTCNNGQHGFMVVCVISMRVNVLNFDTLPVLRYKAIHCHSMLQSRMMTLILVLYSTAFIRLYQTVIQILLQICSWCMPLIVAL